MVRRKPTVAKSKNSTKLSETSVSINKSKERNISPSKSLNKEQEDAKANVSVKRKSVSRRKPTRVQMRYINKDTERTSVIFKKTFKEIRRLQATTDPMIPFAPFLRLVREILMQYGGTQIRIQKTALGAIQEACEIYMTQFFQDAYLITYHTNRVTLMCKDIQLVRRLRGVDDIINR